MSSEAEHGLWSGADPRIVTLRRERDEALAALAVARERAEKAEQERDEHYKTASLIYDDLVAMESRALAAEAALAVAREREQRLTEALEAISWMNDHDAVYHAANRARAALVDEPAAAAEQNAAESTVTPGGTEVGLTVPGAAAATLTCPRCGNETTEADLTYSGCGVCRAEAAAADLVDAVADEPGETP